MRFIFTLFALLAFINSCTPYTDTGRKIRYVKGDNFCEETFIVVNDKFKLLQRKEDGTYANDKISFANFKNIEGQSSEININSDQLIFIKNLDPTQKHSFGIFRDIKILNGVPYENCELVEIINSENRIINDSSLCELHNMQMNRNVSIVRDGVSYPDKIKISTKNFPNSGVDYIIDCSSNFFRVAWICPKCSSGYELWKSKLPKKMKNSL